MRDHSAIPAGAWRTGDDITLETYVEGPDGKLTRGQFLFEADWRSKKILAHIFLPSKSWMAHHPRNVSMKASRKYGLPFEGWYWENGSYNAKLTGKGTWDSFANVRLNFAERLGLKIHHALPGNPKAKIAENIVKLIQQHAKLYPGYVGPDEKRIVFEHAQKAKADVEAGRKTAKEAGFLTYLEWDNLLETVIIPEYNRTRQESRVIGEYLSPNEAWEKFWPKDCDGKPEPATPLNENLKWLFCHREEKPLGPNGIYLKYMGGLTYRGETPGFMLGEMVLVYFDPEDPSHIIISDMKQEKFLALPLALSSGLPPFGASREQIQAESRSKANYEANTSEWAKQLRPSRDSDFIPDKRQVIIDPIARERTRKFNEAKAEHQADRRRQQVAVRAERREDDRAERAIQNLFQEDK